MNPTLKYSAIVLMVATITTGCQTTQQNVGAAGGGVIGGLVCSRIGSGIGNILATSACVLGGMLAGREIGKAFDPSTPQTSTYWSQPMTVEEKLAYDRGHREYLDRQRYLREYEAYRRGQMGQ